MPHRRPSTIRAAGAKGDVGPRSRQPFLRLPFLMLLLAWDRRSARSWPRRGFPIPNLGGSRRRVHRCRTVGGPAVILCRIASTSTAREHLAGLRAVNGLSLPRRHVPRPAVSAEVAETPAAALPPKDPPALERSRLRRERPLAPDDDPASSGGVAGRCRSCRRTPRPTIARHSGTRVATTLQYGRDG